MDWNLDLADPKSATFLGAGWSDETEGPGPLKHRWSTEARASVTMPKPVNQGHVSLAVSGVPFLLEGRVDHQDVWLYVEGAMVSFSRMSGPARIEGSLPEWVLASASSTLELALVLPDSIVPADMGMGSDRRKLGFALQSVKLTW